MVTSPNYALLGDRLRFDDLLNISRAFVVGEPGFGKTRLLQELAAEAQRRGACCSHADLKSAPDFAASLIMKGWSDASEAAPGFLFLDALDEMPRGQIPAALARVGRFAHDHPNVRLFVSCRTHHISRYETALPQGFRFVELEGLDAQRQEDYLRELPGLAEPRTLLRKCSRETLQILSVPRYMAMFTKLAADGELQDLDHLSRNTLFEHFIYSKLRLEGAKRAPDMADHVIQAVQRTLEALALVMEVRQTSSITKDELVSFFDDVRSNLANFVWTHVAPDLLVHHTVLKVQSGDRAETDVVEFECREFQEYLAAKELDRLGQGRRMQQLIYDLMVAPEIQDLLPSWYNALHFLLDRQPDLLPLLMRFGASGLQASQPEAYHNLLTTVAPTRLEPAQRREVFALVSGYYFSNSLWIAWSLQRPLAEYSEEADVAQLDRLSGAATGEALLVNRGNVAAIVEVLVEDGRLSVAQRDHWRARLVSFLKDPAGRGLVVHPTMQRSCLEALGAFKELTLLADVEPHLALDDTLLFRRLCQVASGIDPNSPHTIDLIARAFCASDSAVDGRFAFFRICSRQGLEHLLEALRQNMGFRVSLARSDSFLDTEEVDWIRRVARLFDAPPTSDAARVVPTVASGRGTLVSLYRIEAVPATGARGRSCRRFVRA
jgi:hypothetical protein